LLDHRAVDHDRRDAGARELLLSAPQHAAMASREPEMGCRLAALSEPGARGGHYSRSYVFVSTTLLTLFAQGRPPFFVELL
jgi:hypothetical protein